jgi:hypothetical protein
MRFAKDEHLKPQRMFDITIKMGGGRMVTSILSVSETFCCHDQKNMQSQLFPYKNMFQKFF